MVTQPRPFGQKTGGSAAPVLVDTWACLDGTRRGGEAGRVRDQGDSSSDLRRWALEQVAQGVPLETALTELMAGLERNHSSPSAQAYEELRQSEERLRLGLAASQMGTWDWQIENDYVA